MIETPQHDLNMADLPEAHLEQVIGVYRQRLNDLKRDPRFRYILIFKNYGATAGASLAHPHTQLIATPVTPKIVAQELDAAREHYLQKERGLFCDVIRQETDSKDRIVYDDGRFVALAPFASRFPFEIFLAPRKHTHDFGDLSEEDGRGFARALGDVLRRLKMTLQDPPYNFVLHTAPNTSMGPRRAGYWATLAYDLHWHLEIIPRLTRVAGFEWGTGFYINPTPPEDAARFLREAGNG
jgi:UDPglucose--hexose-1-phosphate uridylyltransferase